MCKVHYKTTGDLDLCFLILDPIFYIFYIALQQQLLSYSESLETFVRTDIVPNDDIDVSTPTITTLEDELKRCQQEYASTLATMTHAVNAFTFLYSKHASNASISRRGASCSYGRSWA